MTSKHFFERKVGLMLRVTLAFWVLLTPVLADEYLSPGNSLAIIQPKGTNVETEPQPDGTTKVTFSRTDPALRHLFLIIPMADLDREPTDLRERLLVESSKPYFQGWLSAIQKGAKVEGEAGVRRVAFAGRPAMALEFRYQRPGQPEPRIAKGYYVFGENFTFFLTFSAAVGSAAELDHTIASVRLEPK